MKSIFKSLILFLSLTVGFTSCREDFKLPETGDPDKAEQTVAGTYEGEWSRENTSTGEIESKAGSIVFELVEGNNNVNTLTLEATGFDFGVDSKSSVCNVSKNSAGIIDFWNTEAKNPFGMTFTGRIVDGQATMTYTKTVRSGRKEVIFNYSFTGKKK